MATNSKIIANDKLEKLWRSQFRIESVTDSSGRVEK